MGDTYLDNKQIEPPSDHTVDPGDAAIDDVETSSRRGLKAALIGPLVSLVTLFRGASGATGGANALGHELVGKAALGHQALGAGGTQAAATTTAAAAGAGAAGAGATSTAGGAAGGAGAGAAGSAQGAAIAGPAAIGATGLAAVAVVTAVALIARNPEPEPIPSEPPPTTIEVAAPAPAPSPAAFSTDEQNALTGNLLADAAPGPGGPLTVVAIAGSEANVATPLALDSGATLTMQADGSFSYDPAGAFLPLRADETNVETVNYLVSDGAEFSEQRSVDLTVSGVNDPPELTSLETMSAIEQGSASLQLLGTDPELDTLSFTVDESTPSFVSIVTSADGMATLNVAPISGDAGTHLVTVTVTDDGTPAQSATTTVTITVDPAPPVAAARVTDQLLVRYDFDEGSGAAVGGGAVSDDGANLTIADPDAVTWNGNSLTIGSATTLTPAAGGGTKASLAAIASNEITVEAWVTPANATQAGPARIVTISADTVARNVTLAQGEPEGVGGDRWTARLRTTETSANGLDPMTSPPGTATTELTHLVFTRSASGEAVLYVNGTPQATATIGGDLSNWDPGYRLLIANETTADRPWLGTLHLVAVYGKSLTAAEVGQNHRAGPVG